MPAAAAASPTNTASAKTASVGRKRRKVTRRSRSSTPQSTIAASAEANRKSLGPGADEHGEQREHRRLPSHRRAFERPREDRRIGNEGRIEERLGHDQAEYMVQGARAGRRRPAPIRAAPRGGRA